MSRFAGAPRGVALLVLAALVAMIVAGFLPFGTFGSALPSLKRSDLDFYRVVVDRVRKGEPYERAAVSQLRVEGGQVKPFLTTRPPALATALAWLPSEAWAGALLSVLAVVVIGAWAFRLSPLHPSPLYVGMTAIVVFAGVGLTAAGGALCLLHEAWAGLLVALSLAVRSKERFAAAVVLGLLAALIRELAMPYLAVMALVALLETRRAEAMAFAAALAIAGAALAWHAMAVNALTLPGDATSPGWLEFGGWAFLSATARMNLVAMFVPMAAAFITPLALVGAVGWKDASGLRLALLLGGYALGFMVIGRPVNLYWGFMTAPLLSVGLCLAPDALIDLGRRVVGLRPNPAR
jgi:hypothetical protein